MSTFIEDFVAYMGTRTDAPPQFSVHSAMAALAVSLGNKVCCDGVANDIYPNIWIVLIARSGLGKSAPPTMAVTLLNKAGLGDSMLPGSFSYEAILNTLAAHPVGMLEVQEFAAFAGMLSKEYMSGCAPMLAEVYDCPPVVRRLLMSGEKRIERPCVTILGASSPDWFADAFKQKDLRGGFYARFLFCPANESGPYVPFPPPPRDMAVEAGLADHLRIASELEGRFNLNAVRAALRAWDKDARAALRSCPPEFAGMRSRAATLILKAAMLLHVARDPYTLAIDGDDLDRAIAYVEETQKVAEWFLQNEVPTNPDEQERFKVLENLRRAGGRQLWAAALKESRLNAIKFKLAVDTLRQAERVWTYEGATEKGRKGTWLLLGRRPDAPLNGKGTTPVKDTQVEARPNADALVNWDGG